MTGVRRYPGLADAVLVPARAPSHVGAPTLGQHNEEILAELGLTTAEIDAARRPAGDRHAHARRLMARVVTRRALLRAGAAASAIVATTRWSAWTPAALAAPTEPGLGPYGPLSVEPDANGLFLPRGFTSRVVAVSGQPVVATSSYEWHPFPDGGATFAARGGGWIYVSNSEIGEPDGGVGAVRFDARGRVVDAYRILDGTGTNCSGGPTPWGRWLSCEEHSEGHVWECDPRRAGQGIERPALGTFVHEGAAVDPVGRAVYLTEDQPDGRLYRFVPTAYPDLTSGQLQAAQRRRRRRGDVGGRRRRRTGTQCGHDGVRRRRGDLLRPRDARLHDQGRQPRVGARHASPDARGRLRRATSTTIRRWRASTTSRCTRRRTICSSPRTAATSSSVSCQDLAGEDAARSRASCGSPDRQDPRPPVPRSHPPATGSTSARSAARSARSRAPASPSRSAARSSGEANVNPPA